MKAFRDGAMVAEFVGARPEAAVRDFIAAVVPTEADRLAHEAAARSAAGDADAALRLFGNALAVEPRHAAALLGLARVHAARGDDAEALAFLERMPAGRPLAREADREVLGPAHPLVDRYRGELARTLFR